MDRPSDQLRNLRDARNGMVFRPSLPTYYIIDGVITKNVNCVSDVTDMDNRSEEWFPIVLASSIIISLLIVSVFTYFFWEMFDPGPTGHFILPFGLALFVFGICSLLLLLGIVERNIVRILASIGAISVILICWTRLVITGGQSPRFLAEYDTLAEVVGFSGPLALFGGLLGAILGLFIQLVFRIIQLCFGAKWSGPPK